PPQTEEVQVTTTVSEGSETTEPETEETEEDTSVEEFDPSDNQNADVYGPPPADLIEEDIPDTDEESDEKPE
ncbi:MAG: hypothetical protein ILP19_02260, partial [Oscillospiraceae bacterium]|nr:hypothetical protein [Oscillospiraceae bacterium]